MNNIKKPIARKMALQVSAVLAVAFVLLLVGALVSLRREVKIEAEHYAKALVSIYGDLTLYEAHNQGRSLDLSFSDRCAFFGEYICAWYRVDYTYIFVPDIENGTITYLSVNRDKDKYGALADDHMAGVTERHVLTEGEMMSWNDSTYLAVEKHGRFGRRNTDVLFQIKDDFGNKALVGAAVSIDELYHEMMVGMHVVAALMLIIIILLAGLMNLLIKHMVADPARSISKAMSEYISQGKRSAIKLDSYNDDEFSMIASAFNDMTEEMDKYIEDISRLSRDKERQQAEVDIASAIQKSILTPGVASMTNCGVKAVMKPAKYIGGDLYDYLELDDKRTLAVVADVSGKGISSAILMAMTLTNIRQFARMGCSPAEILRNVNETFAEENPRMMFITAFVAIYDAGRATLTYANAGHNPPYMIHDTPVMLEGSCGTPLALFKGEEYTDVEVSFQCGDSLFMYTDGVNEAVNADGEFYGTDRLEKVLAEVAKTPERFNVEAVEASLHEFVGDAEQNDDITMLSLRAMGNPVLELDYDINEFSSIRDLLLAGQLSRPMAMELCLAAEECFVNICSYAFGDDVPEGEKIRFSLKYSNKVIMQFTDGGHRFDPRNGLPNTEEYDIDNAVGGLGRLIAFTIADSVDYEYKDGKNILTITKSIKN